MAMFDEAKNLYPTPISAIVPFLYVAPASNNVPTSRKANAEFLLSTKYPLTSKNKGIVL